MTSIRQQPRLQGGETQMRVILTAVAAMVLSGCVAVVPVPLSRGEERVETVSVEPRTP